MKSKLSAIETLSDSVGVRGRPAKVTIKIGDQKIKFDAYITQLEWNCWGASTWTLPSMIQLTPKKQPKFK